MADRYEARNTYGYDNYRRDPQQVSRNYTASETSSQSTAQSSIFSRGQTYARSNNTYYTSPDIEGIGNGLSQMNVQNETEYDPQYNTNYNVPCLLSDLVDCPSPPFMNDDFENWYKHSLSHFDDYGPPKLSNCIFCDDKTYCGGDRRETWRRRMKHIWNHMTKDQDEYEDSRADFDLIRYLKKHRLITKDEYECAMKAGEVYSDESDEELQASNWIPDHMKEAQEREARKENQVPAKEERRSRRSDRNFEKKSKSTSSGSKSKSKHSSKSKSGSSSASKKTLVISDGNRR